MTKKLKAGIFKLGKHSENDQAGPELDKNKILIGLVVAGRTSMNSFQETLEPILNHK